MSEEEPGIRVQRSDQGPIRAVRGMRCFQVQMNLFISRRLFESHQTPAKVAGDIKYQECLTPRRSNAQDFEFFTL